MVNMYYQNVRGLRTKTNEIYKNVLLENYDIIGLTETWLHANISDEEIVDDRYVVYRRDRTIKQNGKQIGGGTMLAVSRAIQSSRVLGWETDCEDLWVTVNLLVNSRPKKVAICVVYLPSPAKLADLLLFADNVSDIICQVDDVIIVGDFNQSSIKWSPSVNDLSMDPINCSSNLECALADFMYTNKLYQLNSILNGDGKILDLIFSSNKDITVNMPPCLLSKLDVYHPGLMLEIQYPIVNNLRYKPRSDYNYFKADYVSIMAELGGLDWDGIFSGCTHIDDQVKAFYFELRRLIIKFVPERRAKSSGKPSWFNVSLVKLLARKDKLRRKFHKFNNPRDELEYHRVRSDCDKLYRRCFSDYKSHLEANIKKNPKIFWNYIKTKRKGQSTFPADMFLGNLTADSNQGVVELFARHFSSVYTGNLIVPIPVRSCNTIDNIQLFTFTESCILKKINKLDTSKAAGPDGIPPLLIKTCGTKLVKPLALIFNRSIRDGVFPTEWKKARIAPIYKKGDRSNIINYRPISILSTFSKLFESVLYPIIYHHVDNIISIHQHGFRSGRSVQTNLVSYLTDISLEVGNNTSQVDAIYTDFSSAFDKVNHMILLHRLESAGIHSSLLDWFRSYLEFRSQVVAVNGFESKEYFADSGVPQGSHLGPILFSIFVNDICDHIKNCQFLLFADDLKIFRPIKSLSDVALVQTDLNNVERWCRSNGMTLNVNKCFFIRFTRKVHPVRSHYTLNGSDLCEVAEIKDLGVTLDNKLQMSAHINNIARKAGSMLGFIRRNSKGFGIQTKITLYNALVLSHLEFASAAWNPAYAKYSQRLEGVQRSFTRHIAFVSPNICHRLPYDYRLNFFKMRSLFVRRQFLDLCFLHRVLSGPLSDQILQRVGIAVPYRPPRNRIRRIFHIPRCRTNLALNSPILRLCRSYNANNNNNDNGIDIFHDSYGRFRRKLLNNVFR